VADDAGGGRREDATRDQAELEGLAVHDHGVTGVVAPLGADHHVDGAGEQVDDLALALVTPLAADEDGDTDGRTLQTR
jgi:hypothetical protein